MHSIRQSFDHAAQALTFAAIFTILLLLRQRFVSRQSMGATKSAPHIYGKAVLEMPEIDSMIDATPANAGRKQDTRFKKGQSGIPRESQRACERG
jgi:hypothetical protein